MQHDVQNFQRCCLNYRERRENGAVLEDLLVARFIIAINIKQVIICFNKTI